MINEIIQGDCLEVMKSIPDKSIDLILTDPPYNISKLNNNRDRSKFYSPIMRRESPLTYDFGDWDNMERQEFLSFTESWLSKCCQLIKDNGTIISFFNKEDISLLGWIAAKYDILGVNQIQPPHSEKLIISLLPSLCGLALKGLGLLISVIKKI
jgi:site-specific DNA-methyltransferase (adenine-specific)